MSYQKIMPNLWFNKEAKEAAQFYIDTFGKNSRIISEVTLSNTPSGDTDIITFEILNQQFMAINAGPLFKINPSISFFINFDPAKDSNAKENLKTTRDKLLQGGKVLMELNQYPFSKYYGWIEDRFGVSWQLILTNPDSGERPEIVPSLLFTKDKNGKALEAIDFYLSVFKDSQKGIIAKYGQNQGPDKNAKLAYGDFKLFDTWIAAMDGGDMHEFEFNEAVSLIVNCKNQEEIDYYWEKLSAVPDAEQCGWLKDKFGISWQIQPEIMNEMMIDGTSEQLDRVTQAFLKMKKFNIEELQKAYNQE